MKITRNQLVTIYTALGLAQDHLGNEMSNTILFKKIAKLQEEMASYITKTIEESPHPLALD